MSGHYDKVVVTISVIDDKGILSPQRQDHAVMPLGRRLSAQLMDASIKATLDLLTGQEPTKRGKAPACRA